MSHHHHFCTSSLPPSLVAVDVVGLDVLAVSEILVELESVLKRLLAVGIGFVDPNVSWLVEVVAFVPNPPLDVKEDVPNPEEGNALCERPLSVDFAAIPKAEPAAVIGIPIAVLLGTWVFPGEGLMPNCPPREEEEEEEEEDSAPSNK